MLHTERNLSETLSESQSESAEKQHVIGAQLVKIQELERVLARLDAEKQDMAGVCMAVSHADETENMMKRWQGCH